MKLNIGNRIKELRRSKEITQEEFADYLGVSYSKTSPMIISSQQFPFF